MSRADRRPPEGQIEVGPERGEELLVIQQRAQANPAGRRSNSSGSAIASSTSAPGAS
jgi:hypothetical protein